jgi:hypothetical protein
VPLTTAIVLIVLADLALIGGLAYVMSRAGRLTPHATTSARPGAPRAESVARQRRPHAPRAGNRIAGTPRSTSSVRP